MSDETSELEQSLTEEAEYFSVQGAESSVQEVPTDDKFNQRVMLVAAEVVAELERAMTLFPTFNSPHEGFGVIHEEFDEFKQEVWRYNPHKGRMLEKAREEAIQLAAMSIRFVVDLCKEKNQ